MPPIENKLEPHPQLLPYPVMIYSSMFWHSHSDQRLIPFNKME